ncbi:MAG: hypothetical protein KA229_08895 [Chitinophagaceae bacterium]|nr:hypothetical protein [Chitinophagaceae bacterium]
MKKWIFFCLSGLVGGTMFTACSRPDDSADIQPPHVKAVYAAGYYSLAGKTYTALWKDGRATVFDSSAVPMDMFVNGNDLYISGIKNSKGYFWKNGMATQLSTDPVYGYVIANSVSVSGTDVHIAGMAEESVTYRKQAIYWKNNVPVMLNAGSNTENSYAQSVGVSGSDVYVAGYKTIIGGGTAVVLWKNGTATDLISSPSVDYGNINLYISGSDVYVTCYEYNFPATEQIRLWKNGTPVSFPASPLGAVPSCLFVNGTDVYIGGFEREGTPSNTNAVPRYWKNGVAVSLGDSPNGADIVRSIYVDGTDVYAGGTIGSTMSASNPVVWKNAVPYTLTGTINNPYGEIMTVFVK